MDENTVGFTACAVLPPPVTPIRPILGKAFSPATITAPGTSTLTITLRNPGDTIASSASLTDTLPSGVLVNGPASTTCGGTVSTGTSSVTLTGGSIPANGSCTVTVDVTAASAGSYINSLVAGALQTSNGSNAAPAVATLTVLGNTPGLSLNKTADRTTYTSGQTIAYTYVLTNTGNVPLTGPFTVNDDKLGTIACPLPANTTTLAPGASVTCTKSYAIVASDLGNVTSLPTGVTANINTGEWLGGSKSTQVTKITGAGPGVPNGNYQCWCIQDHVPADLHNQPGTLYSTVGGSLPAALPNSTVWNKVNYTLNHKIRGAGKTNLAFLKDVQTAIWVLLGEQNPLFGVSMAAQQMITAANLPANSGFVPGPDDVVAVIVYSDGIRVPIRPGEIQESICEMQPLKTIVNHATGSGGGVTSVTVEATVKQVR